MANRDQLSLLERLGETAEEEQLMSDLKRIAAEGPGRAEVQTEPGFFDRAGAKVKKEASTAVDNLKRLRDLPGDLAVGLLEVGRGKTGEDIVKDVAHAPGAMAVGLLEGLRDGGIEKAAGAAAQLAASGAAFIGRSLIPGTGESGQAGEGIVRGGVAMAKGLAFLAANPNAPTSTLMDFAESYADDIVEFAEDPVKMAEENPLAALDASMVLAIGPAAGIRGALMKTGKNMPTTLLKAAHHKIGTTVGDKAVRLQKKMFSRGVIMTEDEAIQAVIQSDPSVMLLRRSLDPNPILTPSPFPHGQEWRWIHEGGGKGQMAYAEWRNARNLENLVKRLTSTRNRKMFEGCGADCKSGLSIMLGRMDKVGGELRFGGIARAGEVTGDDAIRGLILPNGRVVGPEIRPGVHQAYRVFDADLARARYEKLIKDHPESEAIMDAFLAQKETPIVTFQGLKLPKFARGPQKQQFNVKGLEQDEADMASHLIRQAFGQDAFPDRQLWQFNWVPEFAETGTGLGARFRNGLRSWTPATRKRKSGRMAEIIEETGEGFDLEKGLTKAQTELAVEDIRNNATRQILNVLREPLTKADLLALKNANFAPDALPGWAVLSGTGLYGGSRQIMKFVGKNRAWFAEQGIDIPDMMSGLAKSGGRAFKVPVKIADDLGAWYQPKLLSTNPAANARAEAFSKAAGDMIRAPLTFWLSRPSTANRNFISQTFTFAPKIIRDFYRGVFQQIPGNKFEELPWQNLISDFVAIGRMHGKKLRRELPTEMVGSTMLHELQRGPISSAAALPLRFFGFNYHDVSFKRLLIESVYDSQAKSAWHRAVRLKTTGGVSKSEFIRKYRADIPSEVEALAWRESDTWGGYDYASVTPLVEKIRQSNVGRAVVPFPTFATKKWGNTYYELGLNPMGFYRNIEKISKYSASQAPGSPLRGTKASELLKAEAVNSLANLAAGVTTAAIAFNAADEVGALAQDLNNKQTREMVEELEELQGAELSETEIFPATERRAGRVIIDNARIKEVAGLAEDQALAVRSGDLPFLGEAQAFKDMRGGHGEFHEFMNQQIGLGPLWSFMSIMTGNSNDYNRGHTKASRLGQLAADLSPGGNELEVARKLKQPLKLELSGPPGTPAWKDFLAGWAERFPWVDAFADDPTKEDVGIPGLLQPRLSTSTTSVGHYNPAATIGDYLLINTRLLSDDEREASISLMAIKKATEVRATMHRQAILPDVMRIMDENGKTEIGKAKRKVKASDREVQRQLTMTMGAAKIAQALHHGGEGAARDMFNEVIQDAKQRGHLDKHMVDSLVGTLQRYIILDRRGVEGLLLKQTPKRQQGEVRKNLLDPGAE